VGSSREWAYFPLDWLALVGMASGVGSTDANNVEPFSASLIDGQEASWGSQCHARLFPCTILATCLPCLPPSLTKVQDWLHGVLLAGVFATVLCVVQMIAELAWGDSCHSPLCSKQILSGVVVIPSTIYFMKTIGHYDEQLREKKRRHEEEVENLIVEINQQVEEMNELCRKVTENANDFAVGRFKDKSEHFQRFLKGVKVHYKDLYVDEEMLGELRTFVFNWLRNFSQTLINPANENPMLKGAEEELRRCKAPNEICDVVSRRISDVTFSFQVPVAPPTVPRRALGNGADSELGGSVASGSTNRSEIEQKCGITWLQLHRCSGCRIERSPTPDRMPIKVNIGVLYLRILSRVHANLLVALFVDFILIVCEGAWGRWTSFALVITNEACVVCMLACFEQINEIAQLEMQIQQYERRSEEVRVKRDEARQSWEQVQLLHDLWLYRTLPCLSILGKIHNHLADEDMHRKEAMADGTQSKDPRPEFLQFANQSMHCLELKLGPIEEWKKDKGEEWKQKIGRQLRNCENKKDLNELLTELPIITSDLSLLDAAPPSASFTSGSQSSSLQASRAASPPDSPAPSFRPQFTGQ